MENKLIKTGNESRSKVIEGVNKAVNAIKLSIGPAGKAIAIGDDGLGCQITRDGATIAKNIQLRDKEENIGVELVKKAAAMTEEKAGDGTSTTSILIQEFCKEGEKAIGQGANVNELKQGMLKAGSWVSNYIKENSIAVDGDLDKIKEVATISANNDPEVGNLVAEAFKKVGLDSLVTAEMGTGLETTIDITTGMKLDRGWASPQFITNPNDGKCVLENPYVLVCGERISSIPQLLPLLEDYQTNGGGKPLFIVCDEMDDAVMTMLLFNTLKGAIRCCVIKGLDYGDNRKNLMEDLATVVGATHICQENGISISECSLANLGQANKIVVDRDCSIIFEGYGNKDEIKSRADIIRARLTGSGTTDYDKTKYSKRLANLTGGIAVIKAGGASETETANRKATIEDSILAARSAIEEGCAPGGGYIYLNASKMIQKDKTFLKSLSYSESLGVKIIYNSLPIVLKTIAENSGKSGEVILEEAYKQKSGVGFNAKTRKFESLINSGILDSAKVLRVALENSISAASMILLVGCTIISELTTDKNNELV